MAKRALRIMGWIAFVPLCLCLIAIVSLQFIAPHRQVKHFGFALYTISTTQSMEPFLKAHDLVAIKSTSFSDVQMGDVIAFRVDVAMNGRTRSVVVVHQVVEVVGVDSARLLRTQGMNRRTNPNPDPELITQDNFVGQMAWQSRFLGNLIVFMQHPLGIFTIIFNTVCLILFTKVYKSIQNIKE
ncbi:MAG: signal peptidase I [Firmicutes bacterium]|nr:signal peptidase I [Bacillota bacterium]